MKPGDIVRRVATGETGVVAGELDSGFFDVVFPSGRAAIHTDELEPAPHDPAEMLAAGQIGAGEAYAITVQARYLKHAYKYDPRTGLSNARIEPTLHQIFVARRVAEKLHPRMILADEVGLGKTIEAGLIIKELRARGMIERVLIICPANLQLQWQEELQSKFNEEFEVFDRLAVQLFGRGDGNPWLKRDSIICSLPFAANANRIEQIIEANWDLVVFDEAHRVRRWLQGGGKVKTTRAYELADELKELVNGLLLLSATPMQLHPFELFSLLELVEPGLFASFEAYDRQRKRLPALNEMMKTLEQWKAITPEEKAAFAERHRPTLLELGWSGRDEFDKEEKRVRLMDALVDAHPLAMALVRNRKANVGGFTRREATQVIVDLTPEEADVYEDVTAYIQEEYNLALVNRKFTVGFVMVSYQKMLASSSCVISTSFKRRIKKLQEQAGKAAVERSLSEARIEELNEETELSSVVAETEEAYVDRAGLALEVARLEGLIRRLDTLRDSKAARLFDILKTIFSQGRDEKVLIFTQFIETQEFLVRMLEGNGFLVTKFNGKMSLVDKEAAVRGFRHEAQVMISTEAGGEGRNFQFCHILVNYDLPWNPMKVEQRIGRLDRFGQKRPVFIYNLACAETIEERILDVLERRVGLFEESVGSLDPILGAVEKDIEKLVMRQLGDKDKAFEEFAQDIEQQVREARERERVLTDFILDRASLGHHEANRLLNRPPLATFSDLRSFISRALAYFGGTLTEHSDGGDVISLSPKLGTRLKNRETVVRGVFDPSVALTMEDLDFFAFGHRLIDGVVDIAAAGEPTLTGCLRGDEGAAPYIEVFYQIEGVGLRPSGKIVRHRVWENLEMRSEEQKVLPTFSAPMRLDSIPDWIGSALNASHTSFQGELAEARQRVSAENEGLKTEELGRAERIFDYKQVRLSKIIEAAEYWIAEKEAGGTEKEKKILPARKGKLKKDHARLSRLEEEYRQQMSEIKAYEASTTGRVIAAGLVVGA